MDEKVAFYREWLPLPKNDFRILAMLADKGGSFKGSLADMCRCLNIGSGQSKTNSRLRASIESLTADGFITHQKQGNTYTLSLVPKETKIEVFRKWVDDVIYVKGFESESVAWEQVLKLLIWVYGQDGMTYTTAAAIGMEFGVSADVVGAAYKVLDRQYHSILREPEKYKDFNGEMRTAGQYFNGCMPWSREAQVLSP